MKINYKIKRLKLILLGITSISLAVFFILKALNDQIVFFYSPSELKNKNIEEKEIIRVGGLVLEESIKYSSEGLNINFIITDKKNIVNVIYKGVLPDLFREGQGVVAEGKFKENIFVANRVLAKHDENYMPPEVKKALE
tara:strand:+ start:47 stop:463 length:417 start_codon:yes stop_codon:yes gene_type:complete